MRYSYHPKVSELTVLAEIFEGRRLVFAALSSSEGVILFSLDEAGFTSKKHEAVHEKPILPIQAESPSRKPWKLLDRFRRIRGLGLAERNVAQNRLNNARLQSVRDISCKTMTRSKKFVEVLCEVR